MKLLYIFALLCAVVFPVSLFAESITFRTMTEYGYEMAFRRYQDTDDYVYLEEYLTPQEGVTDNGYKNYSHITCDTLFIPEQIAFEGRVYTVTGITFCALRTYNPHIKCVYIPKTLVNVPKIPNASNLPAAAFAVTHAESYVVAEDNPMLTTIDNGVLVSRDGKTLLSYPTLKKGETYIIPEGIETINSLAFLQNPYLEYIEMPATLKNIDLVAFTELPKLGKLCFKDSIQIIRETSILRLPNLKTITIGEIPYGCNIIFFAPENLEAMYCLDDVVKPLYNGGNNTMSELYSENCRLFVPRHSVEAYRADENWGTFKYILPIEPPVVAGLDHAEISWVNNFSATGYEWLLYTDAEQTQLYVTLYFDNKGNFLKMEFPVSSPNYAAAFSSPLLAAPAEPETREPAKEYYTYTLPEGLLEPGVQYYYECRAMKEEEIISTVEGAFAPPEVETSLSSLQTGLQIGPNPAQTFVNLQLDNGSATIADDVFIISAAGSLVAHYNSFDMSMPLDIASLPTGQYLVIIRVAGGQYSNQLIKQ